MPYFPDNDKSKMYTGLNPNASRLNITKTDERSDLQLLGDDINKIFNPSYRRNKLSLSGSFNPDVNVGWDGGPKINPKLFSLRKVRISEIGLDQAI